MQSLPFGIPARDGKVHSVEKNEEKIITHKKIHFCALEESADFLSGGEIYPLALRLVSCPAFRFLADWKYAR